MWYAFGLTVGEKPMALVTREVDIQDDRTAELFRSVDSKLLLRALEHVAEDDFIASEIEASKAEDDPTKGMPLRDFIAQWKAEHGN